MENKKIEEIIEYLQSNGVDISLEVPQISEVDISALDDVKNQIEAGKKSALNEVANFFDNNENYSKFKSEFDVSSTFIQEIEQVITEYLEQQEKEVILEVVEKMGIVVTKKDADGWSYKALNMEEIGDYLPYIEEKLNFIKNMDKEEVLEFMHAEESRAYDSEIQCFPAEILEYMNPDYLKDDEFVKTILGAYIVKAPYDKSFENEYFLLAFPDDYPTDRINQNYKAFYDRLTTEQQAKFSDTVAHTEPALAANLKDAPPYFIAQYLWENDRFEEIFEYDVEDVESHIESYYEEYADMIEEIIQDDEEVIDSKKIEFLSKIYNVKYGKNIEDDEKWSQLLQQNKLLGLWESRDLDKIEEYMDKNIEDEFSMDYLHKKIKDYIAEARELIEEYEEVLDKDEIAFVSRLFYMEYGYEIQDSEKWVVSLNRNYWRLHEEMEANGIEQISENQDSERVDEEKATPLDEMSDEELEKIIADNEERISANDKTIHDKLVEKVLSQQQTIAGQEAEIARLTSQKSKES